VQISVTGKHIEVTDEIREYAVAKASKLPRYYDRVQSIEVVMDRESDRVSVEMIVNAAGVAPFVAKEVGADVLACIDLIVDKLERQLTRHKEKHRNRKHLSRKSDPMEEL